MYPTTGQPPCEACGGDTIEPAFRLRGCHLARCMECGLLFVSDAPPPENLSKLYGEEFFRFGHKFGRLEQPLPGALRNAASRLRWLNRPPGMLLDVGCATGDFLVCARDAGWRVAGVEWSPFAAKEARRRGLDVQNAPFLSASFALQTFDVVTLWDYIEHVPNPLAHLERAHSLLKPGGCLMLSTGDTASLVARLSGRRWHLMIPPKHLFFFSRDNLRRILERSGFRVTWIRWPGKYVNLGFVVDKAASLFPSPITRAVARTFDRSGLGRMDLYMNLRDIMTTAADKPA